MTTNLKGMKSIERIEFYLEPARHLLEPSRSESRRFFLKVYCFLTVIWVFDGQKGVILKK